MSDEKKPEEAPKGPSPATGRKAQVSTNIKVEDFTDAPIPNPYDREPKVKKTKLANGMTLESYS